MQDPKKGPLLRAKREEQKCAGRRLSSSTKFGCFSTARLRSSLIKPDHAPTPIMNRRIVWTRALFSKRNELFFPIIFVLTPGRLKLGYFNLIYYTFIISQTDN
jgi:hypothetical protein